jgi:hypothetical protein
MRGAELWVDGVACQVAHLCVLYDRRMHSQRYYRGHDRQINAIAIAPNQRYHPMHTREQGADLDLSGIPLRSLHGS